MKLIAGRRAKRKPTPVPIENWGLRLGASDPETECLADDGTVLARGRTQPLTAVRAGWWTHIRQGGIVIRLRQSRRVGPRDLLRITVDFPEDSGPKEQT